MLKYIELLLLDDATTALRRLLPGMLGLIVIKRTLGSVFVRHVRFDVCVAERRDVQRVSTLGPRRRACTPTNASQTLSAFTHVILQAFEKLSNQNPLLFARQFARLDETFRLGVSSVIKSAHRLKLRHRRHVRDVSLPRSDVHASTRSLHPARWMRNDQRRRGKSRGDRTRHVLLHK